MAIPHAIGGTVWACSVVILATGLTVYGTGAIARTMVGGAAAVLSAVLIAVTPVLLYQSVQPMSDVPVTAAWMVCWLLLLRGDQSSRWSFLFAGIACAVAILIRPNLAPAAIAALAYLYWRHSSLQAAMKFLVPVVIAGALLAWLQWHWYGSPLRSGYGVAEDLYAFANITPNLSRYFYWIVSTAPVFLLAPVGLAMLWRHSIAKALAAFVALVNAAYLAYGVFNEWMYLRFLLPALAAASVFVPVVLSHAIARYSIAVRPLLWWALLLLIVGDGLFRARRVDTFQLSDQHRRIQQVASHLLEQPEDAVTVAGEQSGALRYYTGRPILRWEAATPESLARAIATLRAADRPVAVALDAWEEEPFRAKFASVAEVSLDWPPAVDAGTSHRTRIWRLADRDIYTRGGRVDTLRLP